MRNILFILAALVRFGAFGQTNIPTRQMLADTNGVVKWPTNITRIRIGGTDYTNLLGFGLSITNGQLSVDTTQLPAGSGGDGLITSVADDFDVSAGELTLTNALGTGPLVRQSAASGSGTVTSVGAESTVSGLAFSNSPVTSSGTLTLTGTVAVASGGTGATDAETARSNLGVLSSRWLTGFGVPSDFSYGKGTYYVNLSTFQVWEQTDDSEWSDIPYFIMGAGVYQPINPYLTAMANGTAVALAQTNSISVSAPLLIAGSSVTIGGTNALEFAATHLTEAEASALYQRTNANLTTLAGASITGAGDFMRTRTGVPREIWIPANAMTPTVEPPTAATNVWATATDGQLIEAWDFSASTTNALNWTMALPIAWDGGTVKAKVAWKQVTAESTSTNRWAIGGGSVANGETAGNTLGTLVMLSAVGANDTNVVSITDATGAITIGGSPSAGHLTWFTIRRHPGDTGDNSSVLARLLGVQLQFTETTTEPSAW